MVDHPACPVCGSHNVIRKGIRNNSIRYKCKNKHKNRWFSVPLDGFIETSKKKQPKVLLFDIETAPMRVFVWGLWKQRVSHENVITDWHCISWAAKWLYDDKIMSDVITPDEIKIGDDSRIVKSMWSLIDEADIVIAHNGDKFDLRRLNTRFILNHLQPPSPYQSIDTLKVMYKSFSFASNRLDYVGKLVRNKGKIKTDYHLWLRCLDGEKAALDEMVKYNREDVVLLEEVYVFLRPWIKSHPNLGLYYDSIEERCPNCGSTDIEWGGYYYTPAGKYRTFRCKCGAIGRSRYTDITKNERINLVASVAR